MNRKETTGCLFAFMYLLFVTPLWYILLFGILKQIDAEVWMWGCYWAYVPMGLLTTILKGVWDIITENKETK